MVSIITAPQELIDRFRFPAPTVCDLSTDPLACAILRCWARQPWAEVHRCALVDRMIELGHEDKRPSVDLLWNHTCVATANGSWQTFSRLPFPRRWMRRRLRAWKADLTRAFGRFE